jgi:S-DNA-T family DNA segregation ATPase FtsK/SpoIIIE
VVDDAELLLDSPVDVLLGAHLTATGDSRTAIVAAGEVDRLLATFRGFTLPLRRARCGVLLCPTGPLDGDLLGLRLPRITAARPGRGYLVQRGRATPVQLARP